MEALRARHKQEREAMHASHAVAVEALNSLHADQMKAHHESAEEAAKAVMQAAKEARAKAHGDGSDRFANSLEESILDLQAMDQENKRKQKERHEQHEKERQALRAQHEKEMQALHARHEADMQALKSKITPSTSQGPSVDHATRAVEDDQLKQLLAKAIDEDQHMKQLITAE